MLEFIAGLPGPVSTILFFAASLFPLVLVHELGHFVVAKLNKVRVDEFGIGFPPRLLTLATIGETEYTVNVLPLGGFVRLAGEDDPDLPGSFAGKSKRARSAILLAGPIANFAFAALIFAAMAMAGLIPQPVPGIDGVKVARVSPGAPAAAAGVLTNDIIVAINDEPLVAQDSAEAGVDRIAAAMDSLIARTDESADTTMRVTVLRGDLARVALPDPGVLETEPPGVPGVAGLRVVSAPAGSDIAAGDIVLMEGSEAFPFTPEEDPAERIVLRSPEVVVLDVTPVRASPDAPGQMGVAINAPSVPTEFGPVAAVIHGTQFTGQLLYAMVTTLARMLVGQAEVEIAGPVGISMMSRQMGEQGLVAFLEFMALLSLNLGVINLLPIPALDGGRLLFIAAEAIRGRRVEPSREAVVHLIGFVLVIGLMAALTVMEVARLTGVVGP